jgi:DMSO/TMAO reductase YedYZ molybdopterin-dependent catalytic subunit
VVLQDNFLLATHFNGEPITPDHGYPLRGMVGFIPGREDLETPYLWKGAKWLRSLEFMPATNADFGSRLVITTAPMSGAKNGLGRRK